MPFKPLDIKERRTGAIDAYYGPAIPLIEGLRNSQFHQRIRTLSQTKWDEIMYVLRLLHQIKDTVIIVHGARGCSSILHFLEAFDGKGSQVISTNLTEDNSIMGAEDKLRIAIVTSFERHNPQAIFVVTTPIIAINNDDVMSVVVELSEELNIPIISVLSDGFKTKIAANGYDIGFHSLAHYLIRGLKKTNDEEVNIITSIEHRDDISYLVNLISSLNLKPNIFPRFNEPKNIINSYSATVSVGLRPDSRILGEFLEKEKQIPFYIFPQPIGISRTSKWLKSVAEKFGRQKEANLFIQFHENVIGNKIPELSLGSKQIYISGDVVIAVGLANLIEEFEGRVIGLSLSSLDRNTAEVLEESYKKYNWDFPIHIGEGQLFEQINIISRTKPDVYLGEWGQTVQMARLGIPSICYSSIPLYGYTAAISLIKRIKRVDKNRVFIKKLASFDLPYSESWLEKNPNWYIKQEVG